MELSIYAFLPSTVVNAPTVAVFKQKLDNFMQAPIRIWALSKASGLA